MPESTDVPTCPCCGHEAALTDTGLDDTYSARGCWVCPQCGEDLMTEVRVSVTYTTLSLKAGGRKP